MTAPAEDDSRLAATCAEALVGPGVQLAGSRDDGTPQELLAELAAQGWDSSRIREARRECRALGRRWPVELPDERIRAVGFARFQAWMAECIRLLGIDSVDAGVRDAHMPLDAEDRRLLADRPPHHGAVG